MTKQIPLTQGQFATVDDWNYDRLMQWKWYAVWSPLTCSFYAVRTGKRPFRKQVHMSREIMHTPNGLVCDHIDHDTLNYSEENLRNVTYSQNAMNRRASRNNKSYEKNICVHGIGYQVQVKKSGLKTYRKYFKTLADAIAARDEALKKFHGEFVLNYQAQEGA